MGRITKIEAQVKNKSRVSIFVDGRFACGLDCVTAMKHRLKEGDEVGDGELRAVQRESEGAAAFEKCVNIISLRPRTEKEIRAYLKDKGYMEEVAEEIVIKLFEYRYLDDRAFAERFIDAHRRRWGPKKLKIELRLHGVSGEIIDECAENAEPQYDEAYELARKYFDSAAGFDKNKLFSHLYRKGFDSDTIKEAVDRLREEEDF
jgi:regulatory protein